MSKMKTEKTKKADILKEYYRLGQALAYAEGYISGWKPSPYITGEWEHFFNLISPEEKKK